MKTTKQKASDEDLMQRTLSFFKRRGPLILGMSFVFLVVWYAMAWGVEQTRIREQAEIALLRSTLETGSGFGYRGTIPDGGPLFKPEIQISAEPEIADEIQDPIETPDLPPRFFDVMASHDEDDLDCYNEAILARVYRYFKTVKSGLTANLDALEVSRNPLYLSDPVLLPLAVIAQESGGSPSLVSSDGFSTVGLMQISPRNKTYTATMLKNPAINIGLGINILNQTIQHYYETPLDKNRADAMSLFYLTPRERFDDPIFLGLAAYNCGYTSLESALCKSFGGPTYAELIYSCWLPALEKYHFNEVGYIEDPFFLHRPEMIEMLGYLGVPGEAQTLSVRVLKKDLTTYTITRYNKNGYPILERHSVEDRIDLPKGSVLDVFSTRMIADGGQAFFQMRYFPGHYIPGSAVEVLDKK